MDFSCGCLFDKKVKEPHFKKSKYFQDLSASFAINAKNEQLGAHYSWLVEMIKPVPHSVYVEATFEIQVILNRPLKYLEFNWCMIVLNTHVITFYHLH
ncbi:unnamed protein product [Rhizopus stolonifer]